MSTVYWILGAVDPEMEMIERLLRESGQRVVFALHDGERVSPESAYRADGLSESIPEGARVYRVECDGPAIPAGAQVIDHHRPGDPGYGRPPEDFLTASSIGQVIAELARGGVVPKSWRRMPAGYAAPLTPQYAEDGTPVDYVGVPWVRPAAGGGDAWDIVIDAHTFARVPHEMVLTAAADHCLAAAYRGECPGVDPDALMRWMGETRATHPTRNDSRHEAAERERKHT